MKTLNEILSDKLTNKNTIHSYGDVYTELFETKRETAKTVLEIGVWFGGSILAWYEYFKNAKIYGMDIMYNQHVSNLPNDRINIILQDAYDSHVYNAMSKLKYDLIIDDGPHTLESMKFTASKYSNLLTDDGILVIEDVQDEKWIPEIKESFPEDLRDMVSVYDLRSVKDRYDDILVVLDKRTQ